MDFVGKSFSGILGLLAIIAVVLVGGYLLIHLIPVFIIAGAAIYAVVMGKRYFKTYFNKNKSKVNKTMKNSYSETSSFKSEDNLDGEVIDVDYKEV